MQYEIVKFQQQEIQCLQVDGTNYVSITSICNALGIHPNSQRRRIQDTPFLNERSDTLKLEAPDGKFRDTLCLQVEFIYGWLMTIDPDKVSPQVRPNLEEYQVECYVALAEYFNGKTKKEDAEINEMMVAVKELHAMKQEEKELSSRLKALRTRIREVQRKLYGPIEEEKDDAKPNQPKVDPNQLNAFEVINEN